MSYHAFCSRLVIYPRMAVSQCSTELDDMILIDVVDDEATTPVNPVRLDRRRGIASGPEAYAPEYHRACAYHQSLLEAAYTKRAMTPKRPAWDEPVDGRARWSDALNRLASSLAGWFWKVITLVRRVSLGVNRYG